MAGEALSRWERSVADLVIDPMFKRYAKSAKEPAALFEHIGEDLASSSQVAREIAFWALVHLMPKLTSILYEWETRLPGWRDIKGKDQQMVNRGMDIVTYLHIKLVEEQRFKIGGKYGKDPRPFVNEEIKNKKIDEWRKHKREVLLDVDSTLKIPDPAPSIEDSVIENYAREAWMKDFRRRLRTDEELAMFDTIYMDNAHFAEVAKNNGVSEDTLRQQFSRARKKAVAERDALFTFLLLTGVFPINGKLPQFPKNPKLWELTDQVIRSVRPGAWLNGLAADGKNEVAVRPLTSGLHGAPAHIYLVAIHKDFISELYHGHIETRPFHNARNGRFVNRYDLLTMDNQRCLKYIDDIINPKRRKLQKNSYLYSLLDSYPTGLPGLNKALAESRDDYGIWLISNSLPDSLTIQQWRYGDKAGEISLRDSKQLDIKPAKLCGYSLLSPYVIYSLILSKYFRPTDSAHVNLGRVDELSENDPYSQQKNKLPKGPAQFVMSRDNSMNSLEVVEDTTWQVIPLPWDIGED